MQFTPMVNRNVHLYGGTLLRGTSEAGGIDQTQQMREAEKMFCKKIGDALSRMYPGHLWAVKVHIDTKTAGASISLPILMGPSKVYAMPLTAIVGENDLLARVKQAGGEILERFKIPRAGLDVAAFLHARDTMQIRSSRDRMPE